MVPIMKRRFGVGLLCLALAGCSQTRQSKPEQGAHGQPINMDPVPSLSQTINRGMGDAAIQQATLPDAKSPMWYGQYTPPPGEANRASGSGRAGDRGAAKPSPSPARGRADDAVAAKPSPSPASSRSASEVLATPSSPVSTSGGAAEPATAGTLPAATAAAPKPPAQTGTLRQSGGEESGAVAPASPGSVPGASSAAPAPPADPSGASESPNGQSLPPMQEPQSASDAAGRSSQVAATPPSAPPAASAPASGADGAGSSPVADRLLGPNPDLMPAMDGPVTRASKVDQTTPKPHAGDAAPKPADPAATEMPLETCPELPVNPQPSKGALTPQPATGTDTKKETGPVGSPSASADPSADSRTTETAAQMTVPRSSPEVRPAMFNPSALSEENLARDWKQAGRAAARVGDEVITLHDLVLSVRDQLSRHPAERDLSPQELNFVAKTVLAGLIERALVVQEAKRALKNPKQLDTLYAAADGYWRERELPPLLRRYMAENENQLKQKFKETNRSLDTMRLNYRQDFLAQVYMDQKLSGQSKAELPEMLRYYNEHLHDKEFDRPAMTTWRELVVEKSNHPNEAAARSKAEDLLARLNKGEDFAALARTQSEGPSSVRAQGGLMQTSPGSYAVDAVNEALEKLPLNQNSGILEGPTSLHIVRVEHRRTAGPASFEELQDQIRQRVQSQKMRSAREQFVKKLKQDTLVTTIFDGTESDPNAPERE